MSTKDALGPFQAGDGGLPPYLAGREYEQEICAAFLSRLRNGLPPPREIVFHGPRGNSKTALLAWLRKEVAAFPGVDAIRLVPAAIRTETKLVERLLPSSWWQRLAPSEVSLYGIKWRPGEDRPPPLDEALAARSAKKPLVLLLDEAHTLTSEVGGALLNASQQVGRELPFLFVIVLTDHQAGLVARLVASGRYQNASEVMREGLRLVERQESEDEIRLEAMRKAADTGIADIAAGRFRTFDTADALEGHLSALSAEALADLSSNADTEQ